MKWDRTRRSSNESEPNAASIDEARYESNKGVFDFGTGRWPCESRSCRRDSKVGREAWGHATRFSSYAHAPHAAAGRLRQARRGWRL